MKTLLQSAIKILILSLFCILSCQTEENIVATDQEGINNLISDFTAQLMANVAANDGSIDNIIDNASCLEIVLPITIRIENFELDIETEEDFEIIEVIYDEFDDDEDILEILFPITITLPDFTEITVNSFEELTVYTNECSDNNTVDDDIECVDFQYPLVFSIFDNTADVIDMITVNSDESLFNFINTLNENDVVSILFPVLLTQSDDQVIEVNNVSALENTIIDAMDECDEDDDNDQNDDDILDITFDELAFALTDCVWVIEEFVQNNEVLTDFEGVTIDFNLDGSMSVNQNNTQYSGNWTASILDANIRLTIDIEGITFFDNNWIIHEFNTEDINEVELRLGTDKISLIQDCTIEDSETLSEFQQILFSCSWLGIPNDNNVFSKYFVYFQDNQSIFVFDIEAGQTVLGEWGLTNTENNQIILSINLDESLLELSGEWIVLSLNENTIFFEDGSNTLSLVKDECPESEVIDLLVSQGTWEISLYEENEVNNTSIFEDYVFDFNVNHSIEALNMNTQELALGVVFQGEADTLQFNFGNAALPLSVLNNNGSENMWHIINFNSLYVELFRSNGNGIDRLIFALQ